MKSTLTLHKLKYLYHDCDLTVAQVAEILNCSSSTIHRALKKFDLLKSKKEIYNKISKSRKKTFLEKYGTEHYMQSKTGYDSYKQSLLKTHGITSIMQLDSVKEKQQKTHFKNHGCSFSIQNPISNNKRLKTLEKKYGNFKKHLSLKNAQSHISTSPTLQLVTTKFGQFSTRSKLEANLIKRIASFPDVTNLQYEPFIVEYDDVFIIPDLLINDLYLIEVKYHKYTQILKPNNLDNRGDSMWHSAQKKLPLLTEWCENNDYIFRIATEKHNKSFETLAQFIANLKIFG